jgi:hypothetical protein
MEKVAENVDWWSEFESKGDLLWFPLVFILTESSHYLWWNLDFRVWPKIKHQHHRLNLSAESFSWVWTQECMLFKVRSRDCVDLHFWYLMSKELLIRMLVVVFWVVMPCSSVGGYQHFALKAEASKMLVTAYKTVWHHNQVDHDQHLYSCKGLTLGCWFKISSSRPTLNQTFYLGLLSCLKDIS